MRQTLRNNGLSLTMFGFFLITLIGMIAAGHRVANGELVSHGQPEMALGAYLTSGHLVAAVFENWESEFLQMGAFVVLTVFLFQKNSPESRDPDNLDEVEGGSRWDRERVPWPVRRGGLALRLYEHSLSLAMLLLFVASFGLHVVGGARAASTEARLHGEPGVSIWDYLQSARLWFESLQNWQSEFLSIGVLVVLAVFLREKGSPESKPVERV